MTTYGVPRIIWRGKTRTPLSMAKGNRYIVGSVDSDDLEELNR
jgi:hypothetical protein